MHLSESDLRSAMYRLTMDVVTIDISIQQQHRYVARRAQVDELLNGMLNESLVEEQAEQPLTQSYKQRHSDGKMTQCYYNKNAIFQHFQGLQHFRPSEQNKQLILDAVQSLNRGQ